MNMNRYREKNWREIVGDLKDGPNFGIHGTKYKNLINILVEKQNFTYAHYFIVGEKQKSLPNEEFYEKLFGSLSVVCGHSFDCEFYDERVKFSSSPSILLGVEKEIATLHEKKGERSTPYGKGRTTFPVGHDFILDFVNLEGIVLGGLELENINKKFLKFHDKIKKDLYWKIPARYFVEKEVIKELIKRIHQRLISYKTK